MDNRKNIRPAICIPIHKADLNNYEVISVKRHLAQLSDYDNYLMVPEGKLSDINSGPIKV